MSPHSPTITRRRLLGQAALATATAGAASVTLPGLARAADPTLEYVPAIVVGSGFGGSVAALRLGQAGVQTLVLEMGRLWNSKGWDGKRFCPTLLPDERAMWFSGRTKVPLDSFLWVPADIPVPRRAGILDRLQYRDMGVYVGRGVGGGSLIHGGVSEAPRRVDFERFLPQIDAEEMYGRFFPLASRTLGVNQVPREWFERTQVHQYSRVGRATAARAGFKTSFVGSVYDYEYLQRETMGQVPRSATAQEIYYGSNYGKRSLDRTYLSDALGTGNVTINALSEVTRIQQQRDGTYLLDVKQINTRGTVVRRRQIACKHLFLGAGTMGTNELLLRARETGDLPDLSEQIGRGWGNNGNVSVSCLNQTNRPTGLAQTTMPAIGIDNRDDPRYPVFAEIAAQPTGFENFTTSYLGVTNTGERATLTYDRVTARMDLDWNRSQADPAIHALRNTLDPIVDKSKMIYRTDLYKGNRAFGVRSCWHPLGGCVLGEATDLYGRVDGYRNLYVTDGALVPGFASVNPTMLITALAERVMDRVLQEDLR
ncbi:MAG: GMC family oxidoreductase [Solirubrobacteraceae bacterium]|nr:GMC family oxidoreductase [Solirubrobacteraceae bacterium]